jgi:multicomponent Na+:H+ antiporter subunit A
MALGFVAALLALALWWSAPLPLPEMATPSLPVAAACVALVAASVAVCVVRDSFVMLLVSGFVGLGSALLFLFLAAPDLAFTQFAVEVAFVVVIAAILLRIRRLDVEPAPELPALPRALLAIGSAAVLVTVLLTSTAGPQDLALSEFFARASVPEAHGRNVVNVILVDFRAADTLGEIAVLAITLLASLPLLALLRARRVPRAPGGEG